MEINECSDMKRQALKKATVQDVAAIANVSVATVSRSLSKPDKVSEKTRQLVLDAVKQTGYTVNEAARSLRRQRTDTIVILLPNIGNSVFSNVVEGIEKVFAANNINVLIADTQKASIATENAHAYFSQNKVDGMVILDGLVTLDNLTSPNNPLPIVFAGEWQEESGYPIVRVDDLLGSKLVAEHLTTLGHRKLGHVTGPLSHLPGKTRKQGFAAALKDLGVASSNIWQYEADFNLESGKAAAKAWYALNPEDRPTGIFCAGDEIAFGFLSTLHQLGIKLPEEVSVVGYDDLDVAGYFVPSLTTVHQPRRQLGELAAHTLLSMIQGETYASPQPIEPYLVVRDSTTSAPKH